MRSLMSARTPASCVLIVPSIVTWSAMMLKRVPPWIFPIVRTRGWRPSTWREMTSCSACTISAATGIGVDPLPRLGAVDGLPRDLDREGVARGEDGTVRPPGLAGLGPAAHVQAEHRLDLRLVESALRHHQGRPALLADGRPLLGRLEEEDDRAGQRRAQRHEDLGRAEEHRGVRVVAAGVHDSLGRAAVRHVVLLGDRQRVHVGAQGDDTAGPAAAQDADDTGAGHRVAHLEAERPQLVGDELPGALLAVAQLGVGVEVAPHRHHLRRDLLGGGKDRRVRGEGPGGRGGSGRRRGRREESWGEDHREASLENGHHTRPRPGAGRPRAPRRARAGRPRPRRARATPRGRGRALRARGRRCARARAPRRRARPPRPCGAPGGSCPR